MTLREAGPSQLAVVWMRALAVVLALALSPAVRADGNAPAGPKLDAPRSDRCILPAEQMRRQHPDMLRHQRDRTVRLGERGAQVVLRDCIACHANAVDGSVVGGHEHFCQGCHEYVGVRLDCFECHNPKVDRMNSAAATAALVDGEWLLLAQRGAGAPGFSERLR